MNKRILSRYIHSIPYSGGLRLLPLMHSAEGYNGVSIIRDDILHTSECPVFREQLLYFFYGKPSYKVGEKHAEKRTDELYCPICFIVNPEKVSFYKVYPFDSGAYKKGFYSSFFHENMDIDCFEIDNNLKSICSYISTFFHNNNNYIIGQAIGEPDGDMELELQSLFNMLYARGAFTIDERANTVEVISKNNLVLSKALDCVILPENLLRKTEISQYIDKHNIDVKSYTVRNLTDPASYNSIVFELCLQYLKEKGLY